MDDSYKAEIYKLNCVEISSEELNPEYSEHPILFVDNVLGEEERKAYERYVMTGRNGMPNWKDYYEIKNLVETLQEIDGLDNKGAIQFLKEVEKYFIQTLFKKIDLDRKKLTSPLKHDIFSILQKLELFFPEKEGLIQFILMLDAGEMKKNGLSPAEEDYKLLLKEDHFFVGNEKGIIEIALKFFEKNDGKELPKLLKKFSNSKLKKKLSEYLPEVSLIQNSVPFVVNFLWAIEQWPFLYGIPIKNQEA